MKSFFLFFCLFVTQFTPNKAQALSGWKNKECIVLKPTEKKEARTAILIIAPPVVGFDYTECRWKLGRKVWEQYMNSHPNVDCYFIQSTFPRKDSEEQVWLEGNTLFIGDPWLEKYGNDRILHKTMMAIEELLPHYTHFIRTNINTFFNLKAVNAYAETHHQTFYTGPLWQKQWYVIGYGAFFSGDVASHMVSEYKRLEGHRLLRPTLSDDHILTALATGVYPRSDKNPFKPHPSLPRGIRQIMCERSVLTSRLADYGMLLLPPISLEITMKYCEAAKDSIMLYRIREGMNLDELARVYEYLLHKDYPELTIESLVDYAYSLPSIKEPKKRKK